MASFAELPLRYRLALGAYPWRRVQRGAVTPLEMPLEKARVALISSAGLYDPARDPPFAAVRGGDSSNRWLATSQPINQLVVGQRSRLFDRGPMLRDRNEAFPLDRLRELVSAGRLGSVAARHPSINGSITAPGRLVRDTAPAIAEVLRQDRVDAALLVPV